MGARRRTACFKSPLSCVPSTYSSAIKFLTLTTPDMQAKNEVQRELLSIKLHTHSCSGYIWNMKLFVCESEIPDWNICFFPLSSPAPLKLCISPWSHGSPLPHHHHHQKQCQQQKQENITHGSLENNVTKLVPVLPLKRGLLYLREAAESSSKNACTWMLHCSVQSAVMPPTCTSPVALTGTFPLSQGPSSLGHLTGTH